MQEVSRHDTVYRQTGGAAEWYVIALSQYTDFRDDGKNIKKSLKRYGDSLEKYND